MSDKTYEKQDIDKLLEKADSDIIEIEVMRNRLKDIHITMLNLKDALSFLSSKLYESAKPSMS